MLDPNGRPKQSSLKKSFFLCFLQSSLTLVVHLWGNPFSVLETAQLLSENNGYDQSINGDDLAENNTIHEYFFGGIEKKGQRQKEEKEKAPDGVTYPR
jgi:hypothetical protein